MNEINTGCSTTNYDQFCFYRLPCGICTRTNAYCPLAGNTIVTPTWDYHLTCQQSGTSVNGGTNEP